jgi:hypothetical protein
MTNKIDEYLQSETNNNNNNNAVFFTWKIWAMIIILLSFIGINVFLYLAQGTEFLKNTLQTLFRPNNHSQSSSAPSLPLLPLASTNYNPTTYDQQGKEINDQYPDIMVNSALNRTINTKRAEENVLVEPSTQNNEKWCYVGKFDGQRICNHMANDDKCASGNIFPTMDVCINPKLRT